MIVSTKLELIVCPRCQGTDWVPRWAHVDHGLCHLCHGRGVVPARVATRDQAALATAEAARQRAVGALRGAGLTEHADRLAALAPVADRETAQAAHAAAKAAYAEASARAGIYDAPVMHEAAIAAADASGAAARAARASIVEVTR